MKTVTCMDSLEKFTKVVLSMIIGGILALTILLLGCFLIDLIAGLTKPVIYNDTAVGSSGDSSFGQGHGMWLIFMSPLALLFGAVVLSFPVYHLLFRLAIGHKVPERIQMVWATIACCVVGAIAGYYLGLSFIGGAVWGGSLGLLLAVPTVWLRSRHQKA
ncbi:hypothetical protein [Stenotrophomonas tumulicola]|uniref:Transmembrane protein n=2 Tax=Stenotrophomonas tumulicola TaxID=1685415 RepID=A0A7W3FK75_9GAMM|nr:hypothetical protein [Stenotrophomonas tumulicola]